MSLRDRIASPLVESDKSLVESGVALKKKEIMNFFCVIFCELMIIFKILDVCLCLTFIYGVVLT